jgi:hypothetical protein
MGITGTSGKPLRVRKKQQENGLGKNTDLGVREKLREVGALQQQTHHRSLPTALSSNPHTQRL